MIISGGTWIKQLQEDGLVWKRMLWDKKKTSQQEDRFVDGCSYLTVWLIKASTSYTGYDPIGRHVSRNWLFFRYIQISNISKHYQQCDGQKKYIPRRTIIAGIIPQAWQGYESPLHAYQIVHSRNHFHPSLVSFTKHTPHTSLQLLRRKLDANLEGFTVRMWNVVIHCPWPL